MGVSYHTLYSFKSVLEERKIYWLELVLLKLPPGSLLALTSSSLLSWRGAVSDGGELRLDVHVVVLDVPGGQS